MKLPPITSLSVAVWDSTARHSRPLNELRLFSGSIYPYDWEQRSREQTKDHVE